MKIPIAGLLVVLTILEGSAMTTQFAGRPYKSSSIADAELRRFVYEYDPRRVILPKDLDPSYVATFIQDQLRQPGIRPTSANQLVELADFYDLKDVAPAFLSSLKKQEDSVQKFLVSVALVRGVGILGQNDQVQRGLDYLKYLLDMQYGAASVPELLNCYNEYSLFAPGDFMNSPVRGIIAQLSNDAKSTPAAETQMRAVEDLYNNALPRIRAAAEIKRGILAEARTDARLDALVDIYLNLDARYREWMERWSARQLLRNFQAKDTPLLSAAFRRGLSRLQTAATSADALSGPRAAGLRAIQFFGDRLSEEEFRQSRAVSATVVGLLTLE